MLLNWQNQTRPDQTLAIPVPDVLQRTVSGSRLKPSCGRAVVLCQRAWNKESTPPTPNTHTPAIFLEQERSRPDPHHHRVGPGWRMLCNFRNKGRGTRSAFDTTVLNERRQAMKANYNDQCGHLSREAQNQIHTTDVWGSVIILKYYKVPNELIQLNCNVSRKPTSPYCPKTPTVNGLLPKGFKE